MTRHPFDETWQEWLSRYFFVSYQLYCPYLESKRCFHLRLYWRIAKFDVKAGTKLDKFLSKWIQTPEY